MKRLKLFLAMLLTTSSTLAHHGWSEYDADKPAELTGTIQESGYTQPHGYVVLKTKDKSFNVVLAPPSRMESRGLSKDMLAPGTQASVHAYPNRSKPEELRAERITINQKTIELR